jgi:putative oxidoreductase
MEAVMYEPLFKFDPLSRFDPATKTNIVSLILRVTLGGIFLYHGILKVFGPSTLWGSTWVTPLWTHGSEFEPTVLQYFAVQILVAWGELLGGLALLFGFLTRFAAIGLIIIQIGAIYLVTFYKGFSFAQGGGYQGGGYEYNLALIAMSLIVVVVGSGKLSVDEWVLTRPRMQPSRQPTLLPGGAKPAAM